MQPSSSSVAPLRASTLRLPSPPQALARVIQAASDPSVPMQALARAASSDASLSVQLLRMVNSSMYNRGSRIATVDRAVAMLGNRSLRNLALCDIAESLIAAWSLPPELAMPMRHHHHPALAPAEFRSRCMLAGQAELLAQVLRCDDKRAALGAARAGLGCEIGVDGATVDAMLASLSSRVDEVGRELGFRVGRQPTMDEILAAANAGLVELNLTYEEVVRRLEQALADTEALTKQLAERNRELEQLSVTDALTGLPNRRALSGRLSYELGRLRADEGAVAFVMGDLDKLESVNDTWGHDFGDVVLKAAAAALREAALPSELVCRIGGEELGAVLPGGHDASAIARAERLREAIGTVLLVCPDGRAPQLHGVARGRVALRTRARAGGSRRGRRPALPRGRSRVVRGEAPRSQSRRRRDRSRPVGPADARARRVSPPRGKPPPLW